MLVYPKCYYETINTTTVITVVIKHVYKSLGHNIYQNFYTSCFYGVW